MKILQSIDNHLMASPVKTGMSSFHAGNLNFPSVFKQVLNLAIHILNSTETFQVYCI